MGRNRSDILLHSAATQAAVKAFSKHPSQSHLKGLFTHYARSLFDTAPSNILKKNNLTYYATDLQDLLAASYPSPAGAFHEAPTVPNGYHKDTYRAFCRHIQAIYLAQIKALVKKRVGLRARMHQAGRRCSSAAPTCELDSTNADALLRLVALDLARLVHESSETVSHTLARNTWINVLNVLRLQDGNVTANAHRLFRATIERLGSARNEETPSDKCARLLRRLAVLEDKLNRMGAPVHVHTSDARDLYRLAHLPSELGSASYPSARPESEVSATGRRVNSPLPPQPPAPALVCSSAAKDAPNPPAAASPDRPSRNLRAAAASRRPTSALLRSSVSAILPETPKAK